jgi:hypothetical protein
VTGSILRIEIRRFAALYCRRTKQCIERDAHPLDQPIVSIEFSPRRAQAKSTVQHREERNQEKRISRVGEGGLGRAFR